MERLVWNSWSQKQTEIYQDHGAKLVNLTRSLSHHWSPRKVLPKLATVYSRRHPRKICVIHRGENCRSCLTDLRSTGIEKATRAEGSVNVSVSNKTYTNKPVRQSPGYALHFHGRFNPVIDAKSRVAITWIRVSSEFIACAPVLALQRMRKHEIYEPSLESMDISWATKHKSIQNRWRRNGCKHVKMYHF